MAKHELHLVHVPEEARARLVALTRRHPELDEPVVLRAVAGGGEQATPIATVRSVAVAEALQGELRQIGCETVIVEQDSLAADLRDRVGQIFGRRRAGSSASASVVAAPAVTPGSTTAATPASGGASVGAGGAGAYKRLYGSAPQDLERADARRRLRIRLAVFAGIVLAMGMIASIFLGVSSLAGRFVETAVETEETNADGTTTPRSEQRSPAGSAGGANDGNAEQNEQNAAAQQSGGNAAEPGAGGENGAAPPPDEPAAGEQQTAEQAAAGEQAQRSAGSTPPRPEQAQTAPQPGENAEAGAPPAASEAPQPEDLSKGKTMRIVVLALAAFIGFVAGTLLLVVIRAIARRLTPARAGVLRAVAAIALVGACAAVVISTLPSQSPPAAPSAAPVAAAPPPQEAAGSGSGSGAAAEPAEPVELVEGSSEVAPASMSAFVRGLAPAPAEVEASPFTSMAQALARRGERPTVAEGSAASEGSGALVAETDMSAAESTPTASMSEFVVGLQPPSRCEADGATPFAAMHCRLDEEERHERRREREVAAAEPEPPPSPDAGAATTEQPAPSEAAAPAEASGEEAAVADSAPAAAESPPAEPPAPDEAPAPAPEPEEPALADSLKREWKQESLACAFGAVLAALTDLIGAFVARRKRQRSA